MDEAERKRQERNRKQREYRARIKANETDEQREERNKNRREQRVLKRTKSSTSHTIGPDHGIAIFFNNASFLFFSMLILLLD